MVPANLHRQHGRIFAAARPPLPNLNHDHIKLSLWPKPKFKILVLKGYMNKGAAKPHDQLGVRHPDV